MRKFVEWVCLWARPTLGIVGAVVAFGAGFWAFRVEDAPVQTAWLFVVGVAGTLLAVIMPVWETRASNRKIAQLQGEVADAKREGRAEFLLVVDFVIRPLLEKLGTLVRARHSTTKKRLAAELKGMALSALKEVIDPSIPRLRANYFKLKYPPSGDGPYLQDPVSTATAPRDRFDLGNGLPESDAILHMLGEAGYVFTADCVESPPIGFDATKERVYRTFISAAAYDGRDVDGMLSVDSPEAGSLTDADATVVQLVASIIAISEAIGSGKKSDMEP